MFLGVSTGFTGVLLIYGILERLHRLAGELRRVSEENLQAFQRTLVGGFRRLCWLSGEVQRHFKLFQVLQAVSKRFMAYKVLKGISGVLRNFKCFWIWFRVVSGTFQRRFREFRKRSREFAGDS